MTDLAKLKINRDEDEREARSGIWKKLIWLLVVIAVFGAAFLLYSGPFKPAKEVKITSVIASRPSQTDAVLNASGYVVAQRKADVSSKATGRLERLFVEEGSRVKRDQVIARLESGDVEAALAQAQADLKVAQASVLEAKSTFERRKLLVKEKLVSEWDYDLADAQYKQALSSVESAKARVNAARVDVESTYVKAPFDGTVLTKNADVGEMVAPFGSAGNSKGAVVSMADMDSLQVEADVSEGNLERVYLQQPCEITLDAFPEKRYRGVVHMIVPTADRAKATVMTKVKFVDKDERVLPEMSAKVAFLTKEITEKQRDEKPKVLIDPAAVVSKNGTQVVFEVQGESVVEKPIQLGSRIGNMSEVVGGIAAGTQVVLNPPPDLTSGTKIRIQE